MNFESLAISSNTENLKSTLLEFYKNPYYLEMLLGVTSKGSAISLRLLDYFIVNYAKTHNISYNVNGKSFDVYASYKLMLKQYSKRNFDPFRRHKRFVVDIAPVNRFETTIGQLCFFRWCFINKILEYVEKNLNIINEDMKKFLNNGDNYSNRGGRKRRKSHKNRPTGRKTQGKNGEKIYVIYLG